MAADARVSVHRGAFHKPVERSGFGDAVRNVSGHIFERLPVPLDGLLCLLADAQPGGGGDDQPGNRGNPVHRGLSGDGDP